MEQPPRRPYEYAGTLLTRSGRNRYRYDAQGRLVGRTTTHHSHKPETWAYEWDADDRLTAVRTPDGTRWRYLYDILGRRVAKRRLTERGDVAEEILFAWDGTTLVEETTSGGSRSWTHDGLRPIAQLDLADDEVDTRFYSIITDLVGTPTELVTPDGNLAWHARRTLWGAPADITDSPIPLRFPGQYADSETGLNYNVLRYYDPETGRYASQDPLGLNPAPNPNTYVSNPTAEVDSLGLAPCRVASDGSEVPMPNITEHGLNHSFDRHAEQWFGGEPTKSAQLDEWNSLINQASGSSKIVPWSSGSTETYAHITRIDGKYFVAQFDRSSGDLVTAFRPNNGQLSAMLELWKGR